MRPNAMTSAICGMVVSPAQDVGTPDVNKLELPVRFFGFDQYALIARRNGDLVLRDDTISQINCGQHPARLQCN